MDYFFKMGLSRPLFFIIIFYVVQLVNKLVPKLGFELPNSGIASDCSTN